MSKKNSKLPAYIYMPAIHIVLGFAIIAALLYPFWGIVQTVGTFLFSDIQASSSVTGTMFTEPEAKTVEEQKDAVYFEDIHWPEYGDQYGKLSCGTIGLESYVYWGDDNDILREGAGTFLGSGIPGNNRTMIIAGHNTRNFAVLEDISVGDTVTFTTSYGIYEYEIYKTDILDFKDAGAYDLNKKEDDLVLYTCYPKTELGTTNLRFFAYGKRIAGPDIVHKG